MYPINVTPGVEWLQNPLHCKNISLRFLLKKKEGFFTKCLVFFNMLGCVELIMS